MRVPLGLVGAVTALAVVGAGVGVAAPRATDPIGLRGFSDCGSLAAVMRPRLAAAEAYSREGLPVVREQQVESTHGGIGPVDPMFRDANSDDAGTTTVAPGAEAADVAKLDGTRLISLRVEGAAEDGSGGALTVRITELGGRTPGERGRLGLPGVESYPLGALLVLPNHRVLVVGSAPGQERDAVVALIDATDPARPVLLRKETVTGSLSSVWLRDGLVGMVLAARPGGLVPWSASPPDPQFPLLHNWTLDRSGGAAALLPGREIVDGGGRAISAGPLLDCAQVWAPERDSGVGMITVRTLDPADGDAMVERGGAFGVLADDDLVQSTADRVYVATNRPLRRQYDYRRPTSTEFHAFARSGISAVDYLKSGTIPRSVYGRKTISIDGHGLRVIASRLTTYYAGEVDVFVLTEKKRRLKVTAQRTELWRDEDVENVFWYPRFAAVYSRSNKGGGSALRRLELRGEGLLTEHALPTYGSLSAMMTPFGTDKILVLGLDVARAPGSAPAPARGLRPYLQASVIDLRDAIKRVLVDKLTLPTDVTGEGTPTYLPGLGIAVILGGEGRRSCGPGPDCFDGFTTFPTVLALRGDAEGGLELAGRLDDPGEVERVLEYDRGLILLTDKAALLTDSTLRVTKRIPR